MDGILTDQNKRSKTTGSFLRARILSRCVSTLWCCARAWRITLLLFAVFVWQTTDAVAQSNQTTVPHAGAKCVSSLPVPSPVSHGPYDGCLDPFRSRADALTDEQSIEIDWGEMIETRHPESDGASGSLTVDPLDGFPSYSSWWDAIVDRPLGLSAETLDVDVDGLTQAALQSSPRVQSLLALPQIRQSDVVVADAEFDPTVFLEGKFVDTSDPVGSTLTVGDDSTRFRDETFSSAMGVRRKTRSGGELEVTQRGGFQQNNSLFLIPNPQGTTRLEINYTHPLRRDGGRAVNHTRILLAKLDLQRARTETRLDLEQHLIAVTDAYWSLYQARVEWLQQHKLIQSAEELYQILLARQSVDSQQRQILRARAALMSRKSELARAVTKIRNAQSRLRLLTGSPSLRDANRSEWMPTDRPLAIEMETSLKQSVITALENRSDVTQAIRKIQAVSARVGAAKNQVLPRLDLILGTYVAGLDDERDTFGAFGRQFSEGRPTYSAGMLFELPVGRRAARARLERSRWEFSQAINDFRQTSETVFTEVEVAVRETKTVYDEMLAKRLAIQAAEAEVAYLKQRWVELPDPNESPVVLIDNLLASQQRLTEEERSLVAAQVDYAMSWVKLRQVSGVLLQFHPLTPAMALGSHESSETSSSLGTADQVDLSPVVPPVPIETQETSGSPLPSWAQPLEQRKP